MALALSTGYTLSAPSNTFADETIEKIESDSSGDTTNLDKAEPDGSSAEADSPADDGAVSAAEVEDGSADVINPVGAAGSYDESSSSLTLDNMLVYEADDYTVEVEIAGKAAVGETVDVAAQSADDGVAARETVEDDQVAGLAMTVAVMDEDDPAYRAVEEYAQENAAEESTVGVSALEFDFTYNGKELDVAGCDISAQVTPSEKLQAEADAIEITEDTVEEAEVGIVLTALEFVEGEEVQPADTVTVEKNAAEPAMMTLALDSTAPALQLVTRDVINQTYTVQYYGRLNMLKRNDDGALEILDTSKNGDGTGGNLPTNGGTLASTALYVEDDGTLQSEERLEELYKANEYKYFEAPSLPYVNIFRDNGNYTATEVWVLNDGADPKSTTESDWKIYRPIDQATELHFTNNPDKENDPNTILIEEDTVIRLVAAQTTGDYSNAVTFYDYDITEDGTHTYKDGEAQGINNPDNYSGNGSKLAFGNNNTSTSLGEVKWTDSSGKPNYINKTNDLAGSFGGSAFGLVTGLDENGHIQYAAGIDAPDLFDESDGNVIGKTVHNDRALGFNRSGDTYTLSSVEGGGLDNLEQFKRLEGYYSQDGTLIEKFWNDAIIYTNSFWPMDNVKGNDPMTGGYGNTGNYVGDDNQHVYPKSDDSKAHNNMFGMQYSIEFELTENYVGPLEYYFFGDDDMWVFLDGRLVCDIGGVHSSIGMYVDLWDYIPKGDSGKHTLKFYYTERGLSGSTCYMQFTLPSVSSATPTYQNSQLKIQKEVVSSANPETEFDFEINIWSEDGSAQGSDYSIVRYAKDGMQVESSLLSDGKGSFSLKAGEYVLINYLQHDTHYAIKETNAEGFAVSSTIDGKLASQTAEVEGRIPNNKTSIVLFTNTAAPKLPNTGGPGTAALMIGGVAALTAAAVGVFMRRKTIR